MTEPINTDIGGRLRQLRGEQTQQEFADLLGIGRTTLIRYESNDRVPDAELMLKLHLLYKVQPLWLLTGWGDKATGVKLTPRQHALLDNYENSDEKGKKIIEGAASLAAQSGIKKGKAA